MNTKPLNIAQVFSTEKQSYVYKIPKYQREYTWGNKEWDLLFNDVIENENGYFIGSIICIDTSSGERDSDTVFEVIDGQQRITTLSLLLALFYEKLSKLHLLFKDDDDLNSIYLNLKKELVTKKGDSYQPRLIPQIQHDNQIDYFSKLNACNLINNYEETPYAKIRKIYRAYDRFSELIDNFIVEKAGDNPTEEAKYKILFELLRKFNSATVVSIDVKSAKDAYMLFESLNNRGIPLSAIDLIKNILIKYAENEQKSDEAYKKWKDILAYLGDEYAVQERFFRQYYNAFRTTLNVPFESDNNRKKYPLGLLATKTTLLDIYEKLIKNDYKAFLDDLLPKAKIYSIITNNAKDEDKVELFTVPLTNLERIQGTPSYLLLLYLIDQQKELCLSQEDVVDAINYLVKFFVRRNITDNPGTRKLNKIFMDTIDNLSGLSGKQIVEKIKEILRKESSDDTYFEQKLRGSVYADNTDSTRFLLCYYENRNSTKEIYTDLWARNPKDGKYIWTIEHIFPEGDNIPQCWIDMIADGDKALAEQYLDSYVHTLGNLTITGYNSNLSNLSFNEKMNRKDKNNKDIGYKNGLVLNKDVATQNNWKIENIRNRTNNLVDFFVREFSL